MLYNNGHCTMTPNDGSQLSSKLKKYFYPRSRSHDRNNPGADGVHRRQQSWGRMRLQECDLGSAKPQWPGLAAGKWARSEAAGGHEVIASARTAGGHDRLVPQRPQVQSPEQEKVRDVNFFVFVAKYILVSVTRFGEIPPLWQYISGLFSFVQSFLLALAQISMLKMAKYWKHNHVTSLHYF